ncbi:MAG: hypothetical protein CMN78_02320 [Spirochaetales bacterium]|nr:hypothetical protein [Spirochaetales bacterium]
MDKATKTRYEKHFAAVTSARTGEVYGAVLDGSAAGERIAYLRVNGNRPSAWARSEGGIWFSYTSYCVGAADNAYVQDHKHRARKRFFEADSMLFVGIFDEGRTYACHTPPNPRNVQGLTAAMIVHESEGADYSRIFTDSTNRVRLPARKSAPGIPVKSRDTGETLPANGRASAGENLLSHTPQYDIYPFRVNPMPAPAIEEPTVPPAWVYPCHGTDPYAHALFSMRQKSGPRPPSPLSLYPRCAAQRFWRYDRPRVQYVAHRDAHNSKTGRILLLPRRVCGHTGIRVDRHVCKVL